jgi:cell wall-associated NlpC family hydrolase
MTTARTTSLTRRSVRGAALALLTGAGVALTPLAASAAVAAPVAAAPATLAAPALTAAPVTSSAPAGSSVAQAAVANALAQQGKPYIYGGTGPGGFDCSGLTSSAYAAAGVNIPRTSRAQSMTGIPIAWYDVQPGDLLFFYSPVSHVGMAIGNGLMVHSSTPGTPVSVVQVNQMPGFFGASRVA